MARMRSRRPFPLATLVRFALLVATTAACSSPGRAAPAGLDDAASPATSSPGDAGAIDEPSTPAPPDAAGPSADAQVGSLPRGPTPATADAKFPFPQNRESRGCTYPSRYD